ncbi:MAG: hypothetical protein F6K18_06725 [Okeania sp. SIO2C2]|uniref:hypothetical protein n=1 Tax=unclassified Okeania TaxID=2634635 RepID=UPI0013B7C998|nr:MULTISPECIES: hypothetical protein [unclassified Okeania]NEP75919.1 hypothetical protein [Okeania sp. SIO2G5]NEP86544.1 hypothetical protein [Okeania sp. SIO2C2]NEP97207.1 hypothetical protein [Okeania sp. SIO2F5]NEQ94781.1 hypothetical protein [Okeania sp. SIO2G4]
MKILGKVALLKHVYDINPNYLGVNPPHTPGGEVRSQEGRKNKKPRVEGESFLLALLS